MSQLPFYINVNYLLRKYCYFFFASPNWKAFGAGTSRRARTKKSPSHRLTHHRSSEYCCHEGLAMDVSKFETASSTIVTAYRSTAVDPRSSRAHPPGSFAHNLPHGVRPGPWSPRRGGRSPTYRVLDRLHVVPRIESLCINFRTTVPGAWSDSPNNFSQGRRP
jgi:hypothetical protein